MHDLLRADRLCKNFLGVAAVSNVSLRVAPREVVSIIGPNGAGKTTLLNMLSGVLTPTSGTIKVDGRDVTGLNAHKYPLLGIARTFQNLALFKGETVRDNIRVGFHTRFRSGVLASMFALPHATREEQALRTASEEIARFLEIDRFLDQPVGTLSYGQQKRVELARALALKPRLLLLDEMISGMSLEDKHDIARYIFQIRDEFDCSILMIEHDLGFVLDISDRIYVLNFGNLIAEGRPEEIANDPQVIGAYIGSTAPAVGQPDLQPVTPR
jgi:branched-chain amino acid transport system ATP-binding protein